MNKLQLIEKKREEIEEYQDRIEELDEEILLLEIEAEDESKNAFEQKYKKIFDLLKKVTPQYIEMMDAINKIKESELPLCYKDCPDNKDSFACDLCCCATKDICIEDVIISFNKKGHKVVPTETKS